MTDPLLESHGPQPSGRYVSYDVLCVRCGYNLRRSELNGNCPECNAPVRHSLHGDVLKFADADWLRSVHRGSWLVYAGILGFLVFFVLGLVFMLVVAAWMEGVGRYGEVMEIVGTLITWACLIALLWGVWLLTRQEPRVLLIERAVSARRVSRSALVAAAVIFVVSVTLPPPFPAIGRVGLAILTAVGLWGCLCVTAELAARVPNAALTREARRRARTLLWTGAVFLASLVLSWWSTTATPGTAGSLGGMLRVLRASSSCFSVVLVVVVVSALSTLSRLRVALHQVLKEGGDLAPDPGADD